MFLFDLLFGCWHKHLTLPTTPHKGINKPLAASITGTYVVCLDCGREFPYDWKTMRRLPAVKTPRTKPQPVQTVSA